jgi:hypothetical protein
LDFAEQLPETDQNAKNYKNGTMRSILFSMQQVYANLGDEKNTVETKKKRMALED